MDKVRELSERIDAARSIVFFGGAGVSTESGIPDFRSEQGLYRAKEEYGYSPEVMLSHSFFEREPEMFYKYYKENLIYPDAQPNAAHLGLVQMERAGKDVRVVTQNIDGLHQAAGSAVVHELHGSVYRYYCVSCGERYDLGYILSPENCEKEGSDTACTPWCRKCGALVRPDVVLYEEGLDGLVVAAATEAIAAADLLIVGGTSLVVYPAAGFLRYFRGASLVLINMSATSVDDRAELVIRRPIGEVFSELRL